MNPHFKQALDEGIIEPVLITDIHLEIEGVKFYQFAQGGTTMSAGRFYAMADMNRDHDELKLDGATLDSAISVIDEVMTKIISSVDKDEINAAAMTAKLHVVNLRQRRKYDLSIERTFDNATAWYFAEDENPLQYDSVKAQRNKALWMKVPTLLDFFLAQPMARYVNWQMLYTSEGLSYLKSQLKMELSILESSLAATARIGLTSATSSTLQSRMATLNASIGFLTDRLKNISPSLLPTTPKPKKPNAPKKKRRK
jgi:hypothetical protein